MSGGRGTPADRLTQGILLMVLAMASFTVMDTVAKLLTERFDGVQIAWARFAFSLPPVLLAAIPYGLGRLARTDRPVMQAARGVLFALSAVCIILAFAVMPLAEAIAISFVAPFLVVGLSAAVLGERVGPARWLAVACGFAGMLVIVWPAGAGFDLAGSLLTVAAASFWAVGVVLTRRLRTDPPLTSLFHTVLAGSALLSLLVPFFWRPPALRDWLLMLVLGLLNGLSNGLLIAAFTRTAASVLAPFQYVQLVWATLLGWLVFDQLPGGRTLGGAAIVIAAGLLVWWHERRAGPAARLAAETA